MHPCKIALFFLFLHFCWFTSVAQSDSIKPKKQHFNIFSAPDTGINYRPKTAIVRSAILPGWGQITNKKYWKLPLVYGALGITTGVLVHNIKQYKVVKAAFINATDRNDANNYLIPEPYYSVRNSPDAIRNFRNQVRQNVDYSVLFILLFWGLNVVDATVDAHLKTFDIGPDLSLQLNPGYSPLANTNGLSLVLKIGASKKAR